MHTSPGAAVFAYFYSCMCFASLGRSRFRFVSGRTVLYATRRLARAPKTEDGEVFLFRVLVFTMLRMSPVFDA